jgi:hypothetical protein
MVGVINVVHLKSNIFPISMKKEFGEWIELDFDFCRGKVDRQDVYQAPYIWVQFLNPKPNVLINVLCRAYGQNIDFDKKTGRALTRFQIYVEDLPIKETSSQLKI